MKQYKSKSSLQKLYELLPRESKIRFIVLNLLMFINALLELVGVGAIPGLILLITNPEKLGNIPYVGHLLMEWQTQSGKQVLFFAIIALFLVFLVKNLFALFLNYLKGRFVRSIQIDLSQRLLRAYLLAPYSFHLSAVQAELIRNVNGEVNQIVNQVLVQALELLLNLMMGVAILMLLFTAEPTVSLVALSVFGVISFLFLKITRKKIKHYGNEAVKMRKEKSKLVLNSLNLIKEIKILGKEEYFSSRFHRAIQKEAYVTMHKAVMDKVPRALLEVLSIGLMLSIILAMVYQQRDMSDMIAVLALFAVAAARLMPVANQVSTAITNVRYALPSIDPIYRDLTSIAEEELRNKLDFDKMEAGAINVSHVSFAYQKHEARVLTDLSLEIPLGSSVAFVGPSGAGKTTLMDILLGLLPPTSGQICCNGQDIFKSLTSWRQLVGYVPQQITLINDSLINNICLGENPASINRGKVLDIIRQVQLEDLLHSLPEGLDTVIGDRGVRLSGGQRQRVGIARALYCDPKILIMDEATSALDNITEKFVVQALEKLRRGRTIIMIAHRLTTVEKCDRIFFLDGGKIVASGTYNDLLRKSEDFKRMAMAE